MLRIRSHKSQLLILLLARIALDLDFQSITLFFTSFSKTFNIEIWLMGFVISVYSICVLFSPIFGNLSDQYGRRNFLVLGLTVFAISSGFMAVAQDWIQILVSRAFAGLGKAIFLPSLLAELADNSAYEKRTRAMGFVRLSWPLTFIIGVPLVGYSIEYLNWRLPFAVLAIFALITGLLIIFMDSSSDKWQTQIPIAKKSRDLFKIVVSDRSAISGLLLTLFAVGSIQGIFAFFPVWMESDFHIKETAISFILSFMGVGTLIGTLLATAIGDKMGSKKSVVLGLGTAAGCMILLSHFSFSNPIFVVFWLLLLGTTFDFSMTVVPVLLTKIASEAKGTILSLNQALNAGASALGSAISGILWINFGYSIIGLFFGCTAFIGALIGFFNIKILITDHSVDIER
jgi:DHA1 family multidrug resistance protein-like MFS transporter